jgi:two-component system chemotaxis response regulator CheY
MAKSILIVDDSIAVRQSTRFVLEQAGYSVHEAGDGLEALSALNTNRADLVITDVNMPNMDGITLVKKIREREDGKFTPILVLTTESQGPIVQKGKDAGATGWIVKPFTGDKLIDTIRRVTG